MSGTKYIISYSGGLGSGASVLLAHELGLDYEAWFADTQIEDEDLYRFNRDIEAVIGRRIRTLADGRDPWEIYEAVKYIGNARTAHCSQILKTDQVRQNIVRLYGQQGTGVVLVLGMSLFESDRIERARKNWAPINVTSLLVDHGLHTRDDILAKVSSYNIAIPRLYAQGFPHNNCGGFCVRAGLKQFATLLETNPNRYEYHAARMRSTMKKIGPTAVPFLREVINGETKYLTLDDFREKYEAGKIEVSPFDYEGCNCFVEEIDGHKPRTSKDEARQRRVEAVQQISLEDLEDE